MKDTEKDRYGSEIISIRLLDRKLQFNTIDKTYYNVARLLHMELIHMGPKQTKKIKLKRKITQTQNVYKHLM